MWGIVTSTKNSAKNFSHNSNGVLLLVLVSADRERDVQNQREGQRSGCRRKQKNEGGEGGGGGEGGVGLGEEVGEEVGGSRRFSLQRKSQIALLVSAQDAHAPSPMAAVTARRALMAAMAMGTLV